MGQPDVVPVVIRRREPFEVVILALLFVSAVTQLLVKQPPGSIAALIPGWYAFNWSCLTILGTGVALVGVWTPSLVTGLFIERLGINITNMSLLIYAGAVLVFAKTSGMSSAGLIVAGLVAFWLRQREITHAIKRMPHNAPNENIFRCLARKFKR